MGISFEIFFWMPDRCYVINAPRTLGLGYVFLGIVASLSYEQHTETACWLDIQGLTEQSPQSLTYITGQVCMQMWHISCGHVKHVPHPNPPTNSEWGRNHFR